jgi:hypothetical protein
VHHLSGENSEEPPPPVEVVGVRGPAVPLPFTTAPVAPPPRSRWPRVVLTGGVVAALTLTLFLTHGTAARPGAVASPAPSAATSPVETAADLVNRALAAQSRALLAGDLAAYLEPVDAALREEFTLRFGSLRALGVAAWTARVTSPPVDDGGERWTMMVDVDYCLGAADCAPARLSLRSTWSLQDGRAVVTAFERTVLPWDLTPLQAVAGRRVIVAAPAGAAGRLAETVAAADKAADIADRYARWDPPPKRYVVYVAGPDQWRTWWNGGNDRAAGYAQGSHGVTVKAEVDDGLTNLLAHEFTHVVSLGDRSNAERDWWLVEGLAEYVADRDGTWTPARLPHVRRYVRAGRWDGTLTLGQPPKDVSEDDGQARYGLALLAVTCLAKRFGEDRMLEFFAAVVRDRSTPDAASPTVLGTDWAPVAADCTAQIRARAA